MRLDSPVVLATAGTLAIHLLLAVAGDAIVVLNPVRAYQPPPVVELVDIDPPEVKPPPPPVEKAPEPEQQPTQPEPQPAVQKIVRRTAPAPAHTEPPPPETPPPASTTSSTEGGAPVAQMEGVAPSATGVPVAYGKPHDRVGRGGTGTGTGAGSGAGSSEPTQVASIATIKTRAMPRGDFSYVDASKDYPPEAKALGIEGVIRVRLVVDDHGKVIQTTLLNRLGHGLDELALARATKIEFDPAKDTDDKAVRSVVIWTFNMTLPK